MMMADASASKRLKDMPLAELKLNTRSEDSVTGGTCR